ncbi:MAG TPA: acyl-CoA synthetase [Myxococcota bacterium]|nr:acyl-CoA synthetase [Myxococcota bacterium]
MSDAPLRANLAEIHEALASALPERECIVFRDRRLSWAEVTDRTRRLAGLLRGAGLGCHRERAELAAHEAGQDRVALYLHNGNEYLEGMLGAMKARAVSFNVNYRYVDEELLYLFGDADPRAVLFHACFAPVLARLRERLPGVRLWLQVADGSGEPLLPGALDYEAALAGAEPEAPAGLTPDDLYVLYTGGTTGMPKGVLWRQDDIYHAAMAPPRVPHSLAELCERAARREPLRAMPTPPLMHGAAQWIAFSLWNVGGTLVFPARPERFDPDDVWDTAARERVNTMTIVGDAFGRPLVESLDRAPRELDALRQISSGGAILSADTKAALLERLPGIRILDVLGSSESGTQAVRASTREGGARTGDFDLGAGNVVLSADLSHRLAPGSDETGWLARTGRMPLGYLGDPEKTARTFPVVGGVRHAVPGDRARVAADGTLRLLGRDSVTINTGGEKVFAEEVEQALKAHGDVWDCLVVGAPHPRFGQQVVGLVAARAGAEALARGDADALAAVAAEAARHLAAYKRPRHLWVVPAIQRSPSGKPDYGWGRALAAERIGASGSEGA